MLNWRLENAVPPAIGGNPNTIAQFAARYDRMADALYEAVEELRALANEGITISLAVDEVRDRASDAIDNTRRVAVRYAGASTTLNSYQQALAAALRDTNSARNTISGNNPNAGYWRRRELELRAQLLLDPTNNTIIDDLREASNWVTEYDDAYLTSLTSYNNAVTARDHAVTAAIAGLDDAANEAGLNNQGFWDDLEGAWDTFYDLAQKYLAPVIEIIRNVLEIIKQIVDILALIVSILAIFIPVLAPFAALLTVISLALSALILICSLVLFALGKETLGRVIGDIIDLAVGALTAKLGPLADIGGASNVIASTGGRALLSEASIVTKFMFGAGTEIAAGVGIELLKGAGETILVDFATNLATDIAEDTITTTVNDWAVGGAPWGGGGGFEPGNYTWDSFGEGAADALTGGAVIPFIEGMGISENITNISQAGATYANNVGAITAVPAG